MDLDSDVSRDEVPTEACPPSKRACCRQATDAADQDWPSDAGDLDVESEWQARLREESGAELRGGDEEDWDRYAGVSNPAWHRLIPCLVGLSILAMLCAFTAICIIQSTGYLVHCTAFACYRPPVMWVHTVAFSSQVPFLAHSAWRALEEYILFAL